MKALFFVTTLAILAAVVMLALRAPRFARLWRARKDERRRIPALRLPPERLAGLVRELLVSRGFQLDDSGEGATIAHGPADERLVVQVEAMPPQERVPSERVLELASRVEAHHAHAGLLVTPYHIDRGAAPNLPVNLELMDGRALLAAVERELPHHAEELRRFRLTGTEPMPSLPDHSGDEALARRGGAVWRE